MKLRNLPLSLAAAAAVLIPVAGFAPAYAVPDPPNLINASTATAGHVTGDAESTEPWVYVGLQADQSDAAPFATDTGTAHYDVATWGYGNVTVHAWACPAQALDATCSDVATVDAGAASDVTLPAGDPVWFTDDTVGPEGSASVTITEAAGGGTLVATWAPTGGTPLDTTLTRGVATPLTLSDGDGTVTINRCSATTPTQCVPLDPATSKALHVDTTALGVTVGTIADITGAHKSSTFVATADQAGDYSMTYHLEATDNLGVAVPNTTPAAPVTGTLDGTNATAATPVLAPASVPDGTYQLVGTITVTNATYGPYTDVAFSSGTFTIHRSGPALTSVTASPTTIYPLVKNSTTYPSVTKFTVVGATAQDITDITTVRIFRNATGALVRTLSLTPGVDATHATVAWGGLLADTTTAAPAGLYLLKLGDADGNTSSTIGQVTVSGKKLVLKTWKHTYLPGDANVLADKYVGKCSTLRTSVRGWYKSLGYYANTQCTSQTSANSLVSTLHAVFLPRAYQYVDVKVTAYGGAAKSGPGSKARIRYLTTKKTWTGEVTATSTLGYHSGPVRSTTGLVFPDRSFGWGFYTGFGYKYDVKSFTVVLHYKVLE
ncbi:MAG: hypothetical protein ACJ72O_05635 [Marmoricola sp.]